MWNPITVLYDGYFEIAILVEEHAVCKLQECIALTDWMYLKRTYM